MRRAVLAIGLAVLTLVATTAGVEAKTVVGTVSHVGYGFGRSYLALPEHRWGRPGIRVKICGPAACITRTSTDAGPDKAMQRAGRIADLNAWDFRKICGCDPFVKGLLRNVKITYLGKGQSQQARTPLATLPPTDTDPSTSGGQHAYQAASTGRRAVLEEVPGPAVAVGTVSLFITGLLVLARLSRPRTPARHDRRSLERRGPN